jgi:hypothetical protein
MLVFFDKILFYLNSKGASDIINAAGDFIRMAKTVGTLFKPPEINLNGLPNASTTKNQLHRPVRFSCNTKELTLKFSGLISDRFY